MKGKLGRYAILGLVAVVGAFAVVFSLKGITGFLSANSAIEGPVRELDSRRAKIQDYGISLDESSEGANPKILIASISNSDWAKKYYGISASAESADELISSPALKDQLVAEAQANDSLQYGWPGKLDFNVRNAERNSQLAAGSIQLWVEKKLDEKDYEAALNGLEWMDLFVQILARSPDENAVVLWFGINLDILRVITRIKTEGALTPERYEKVKQMLDIPRTQMSFKNVVYQKVRESVATTRFLPELSQDQVGTLVLDDKDQVIPKFEPKMLLAIESKMLAVWDKVLPVLDMDKDPEEIGIEIDRAVFAQQTSHDPTDFMVQALPDSFEQFGRLIHRVAQAKAAVSYWLNGNVQEGTHKVPAGKGAINLSVSSDESNWYISTKAVVSKGNFRNLRGLEVNQAEGVQLLVAK
ncbi:MAG: hypothetical protein KF824_05580 [Fimbriimonadaceae bacterium]|nr:MAG: hypothetical protein KF824_05580 [Fimbriimonadaceae bacterium]